MNEIKINRLNINKIDTIYGKDNPIPQVDRLIKKLIEFITSSK